MQLLVLKLAVVLGNHILAGGDDDPVILGEAICGSRILWKPT